MSQLALLIDKLKQAKDPTGSPLLDSTVVLWANHMGTGGGHGSREIPWVLAGSAGGYLKTGQYIDAQGGSLNAVMKEICRAMGVNDAFGDAKYTDELAALRA